MEEQNERFHLLKELKTKNLEGCRAKIGYFERPAYIFPTRKSLEQNMLT